MPGQYPTENSHNKGVSHETPKVTHAARPRVGFTQTQTPEIHPLLTLSSQQLWAAQNIALLKWALGFWPKIKTMAYPWR